MPVHEKTWKAKTPLLYVLLFLLNIALVLLVEIAFLYTQPRPLTPEILASKDPIYENCRILQESGTGRLVCYLVETQDGDTYLISARQHRLFHGKYLLMTNQATLIPEEGTATVTVKLGLLPIRVYVENQRFAVPVHTFSDNIKQSTTWYMLLGALLELLEMGAYYLIKKNL